MATRKDVLKKIRAAGFNQRQTEALLEVAGPIGSDAAAATAALTLVAGIADMGENSAPIPRPSDGLTVPQLKEALEAKGIEIDPEDLKVDLAAKLDA